MIDYNTKSTIDQRFREVKLVHLAMLLSLLAYLGIGVLLRPVPSMSEEQSAAGMLIRVFYFLSATVILLIFFLRKKILLKSFAASRSLEESLKEANSYRTGQLIIYIFCEFIGLFGLILLFLTGSFRHFLNLILASFILLIVLYPRKMAVNNL